MVCIAVEYTVFSTAGVSLCRKKRSDVPQFLQTAGVGPECLQLPTTTILARKAGVKSRNAFNYQPLE